MAYTKFVILHQSPTRSVLREMLFGSTNNVGMLLQLPPCRLVVDGIDESVDDEQKLIVEDLMHTVSSRSASTHCKLLICSRDVRTISKALGKRLKDGIEISLTLERDFLNSSIRSFVSKRLEDMRDGSTSLWGSEQEVGDIQQVITERADGKQQFPLFIQNQSPSKILQACFSGPSSCWTYFRILTVWQSCTTQS